MEQTLVEFLSAKAVEDLRSLHLLDEEVARAINRQPFVDSLRKQIRQSDIEYLMRIARGNQPANRNLSISLLRPFDQEKEVKDFFRSEWQLSTEYEHRLELMWRLLDDENLPLALHEEIFTFVKANIDRFTRDRVEWCGGPDRVLDVVEQRLSDPRFPRTKDWVYLCATLGSPDKNRVTALISRYRQSEIPFVAEVADFLFQYLLGSHT